MVRSRTSLSVSSPSCPLCERHHREVPGTLMTCLLIVAPSTPIAGWFLSSSRGNYTTRPSDLHHDGQLWSLNLITSCLWALSGGQCDQLDSDDPRGAGRGTMRATQSPRLRPQGSHRRANRLAFGIRVCATSENVTTELTPGFAWSHRIIILEAFSKTWVPAFSVRLGWCGCLTQLQEEEDKSPWGDSKYWAI
jgi:hypothetical protein